MTWRPAIVASWRESQGRSGSKFSAAAAMTSRERGPVTIWVDHSSVRSASVTPSGSVRSSHSRSCHCALAAVMSVSLFSPCRTIDISVTSRPPSSQK